VTRRGHATEAIVLREIAWAETSQVVHLATPEHGLVPALAKGARRPGPEFQGGVPLGAIGEAVLSSRRGSDLEVLRSFRATADLRALGRDLDRFHAACWVLEVLRAWMRPALPLPALYRAGAAALRLLVAVEGDAVRHWVAWFEARAVAAAGHRPRLDACAVCGEAAGAGDVFSPAAGGLAHDRCAPEGPRRRVGGPALAALRRVYAARIPDLVAEPLPAAAVREVRAAHDVLFPWLLERRPDALEALPR
jgi:DNA repair protein RecO (recombination protein O)